MLAGDNALVSQRLGLNIVSTLCIHAPIAAHFEAVLPEIIAILHSTYAHCFHCPHNFVGVSCGL